MPHLAQLFFFLALMSMLYGTGFAAPVASGVPREDTADDLHVEEVKWLQQQDR
ncbi:uncharacterized protein BXZ73DRAFT_106100 [Epithele typhae]|uniref:uncharacterized protein n=1 Tax=Epithele typhae TaxID=378194 RepID=UPI00200757D5|nr:uncharacterized protein BXZ73DRAFT_107140 [Epithele typhae]XP_047872995.1 uncharacterized protein BXZ73DRAFT_106100 [Epithele typhae]KAH9912994.1 hypothetical protein BXZ73DRAFT_107140 [Epithele typhae]KAH9915551.1 hypothetical protein BXZ73DRAFT_106100 [Epithele typhae]